MMNKSLYINSFTDIAWSTPIIIAHVLLFLYQILKFTYLFVGIVYSINITIFHSRFFVKFFTTFFTTRFLIPPRLNKLFSTYHTYGVSLPFPSSSIFSPPLPSSLSCLFSVFYILIILLKVSSTIFFFVLTPTLWTTSLTVRSSLINLVTNNTSSFHIYYSVRRYYIKVSIFQPSHHMCYSKINICCTLLSYR